MWHPFWDLENFCRGRKRAYTPPRTALARSRTQRGPHLTRCPYGQDWEVTGDLDCSAWRTLSMARRSPRSSLGGLPVIAALVWLLIFVACTSVVGGDVSSAQVHAPVRTRFPGLAVPSGLPSPLASPPCSTWAHRRDVLSIKQVRADGSPWTTLRKHAEQLPVRPSAVVNVGRGEDANDPLDTANSGRGASGEETPVTAWQVLFFTVLMAVASGYAPAQHAPGVSGPCSSLPETRDVLSRSGADLR